MRDDLLIGTLDAAVAAAAFGTEALLVSKAAAEGIWVAFQIKRNGADADEVLDITMYAKDTDAAWAVTDDECGILPTIVNATLAAGATIIRFMKVQTNKKYIKPRYVPAGTTPSYDLNYWVVSGVERDTLV